MLRVRFILIIALLATGLGQIAAQSIAEENCPVRTPEVVAQKQTQMLIRELCISDSAVCQAVYQIFLKYAHLRRPEESRTEMIDRLTGQQNDLKKILTPEQFRIYMNCSRRDGPRSHHNVISLRDQPKDSVLVAPAEARP